MPKKKGTGENGETSNKKARHNVKRESEDVDLYCESDSQDDGEPSSAIKGDFATFRNLLLNEMDSAANPKEKYRGFDFSRMRVEGYDKDQLRSAYERLRADAFRRVRRLSLKQEVKFLRDYGNEKALLDKEKQKRIPTAYLRFLEEEKPKLEKKHPELGRNFKSMIPIIADRWRKLSPDKRRRYQEAYEEDRKIYLLEHPKTTKPKKTAQTKTNATKQAKPKLKSAFDLFCDAKRDEYSRKYGLKGVALTEKMARKFAKLSDTKREKWDQMAREAVNNYVQDLATKGSLKTEPAETATSSGPPGSIYNENSWL